MKTINKVILSVMMVIACSLFIQGYAIGATRSIKAFPSDTLKSLLIKDWERARAYTKAYLAAMPEDGTNFKPTPEMRSFAEQMLHLSQGIINHISAGTGKEKIYKDKQLEKMDEYKTKAALEKVVMECYEFAITGIRAMDASKFDEVVNNPRFKITRLQWLMKAFEHQTHHRGQTTVYIRLKGIAPPNEMLF